MGNIFQIYKGTKIVIITMTIIVFIGLVIAFLYYGNINQTEDPRVVDAKIKYKKYNDYIEQNNFDGVLSILDTIEKIYLPHQDYKNSFEVGVIYNNRAAAYLSIALYQIEDKKEKDSFINIAKKNTKISINIYKNWLEEFEELEEEQIENIFKQYYTTNNPIFKEEKIHKYLNKRVHDIILAQKETPRRISVSYTNLGIIHRHQLQPDSALIAYKNALDYWSNNLAAENNLNVMIGKPIRKRTFLEKLFPDEK